MTIKTLTIEIEALDAIITHYQLVAASVTSDARIRGATRRVVGAKIQQRPLIAARARLIDGATDGIPNGATPIGTLCGSHTEPEGLRFEAFCADGEINNPDNWVDLEELWSWRNGYESPNQQQAQDETEAFGADL